MLKTLYLTLLQKLGYFTKEGEDEFQGGGGRVRGDCVCILQQVEQIWFTCSVVMFTYVGPKHGKDKFELEISIERANFRLSKNVKNKNGVL